MSEITLENGKYTLIRHEDGRMEALRYGEKWRDLTGDKLIAALIDAIDAIDAHLIRAPVQVTDEYGEPIAQKISKALGEISNAVEDVETGKSDVAILSFLRLAQEYLRDSCEDLESLSARLAQPVVAKVPDVLSKTFPSMPTLDDLHEAVVRSLDNAEKAIKVLSTILKNAGLKQGYVVADEMLGDIRYAKCGMSVLITQPPPPQAAKGGDVNGEPVAWMWNQGGEMFSFTAPSDFNAWRWTPLYTHPAEHAAVPDGSLLIDVRGKWYDVPIPVHLHIIALRDKGEQVETVETLVAVYDAVSRSNITRDVKTPETKARIVRDALSAAPTPAGKESA